MYCKALILLDLEKAGFHQFELGKFYAYLGAQHDSDKAIYWMEKAAQQGDIDHQWKLIHMYIDGRGINQDFDRAIYWLAKVIGKNKIGSDFSYENFTAKDPIDCITKAAEEGHYRCQTELGNRYAEGRGVKQDLDRAIFWLSEAKSNTKRSWQRDFLNSTIRKLKAKNLLRKVWGKAIK